MRSKTLSTRLRQRTPLRSLVAESLTQMNDITARWKEVYNELLRRQVILNAADFCLKTKLSTSTITEILKERSGVGPKTINATLSTFDIVSEPGLKEGRGPLFKTPSANKSLAKQILELKELMDNGVISKREFEMGKKKILT